MTVKEICDIIEETNVILFEIGRVFDGHVYELEPGEPVPEKYANRQVLQLEAVAEQNNGEKEDGVIYLIIDR